MKTIAKQLVAAVALAGMYAGAQAATTDLGTVSTSVPKSFNGAFFGSGSFSDILTFDLPANLGSAYSVINFPLSGPGFDFNTVLSTISLVSNPDGILFNGDDQLLKSSVAPGGASLAMAFGPSDSGFSSAGGSYYINITGLATGTTGGIYNGSISAVPIPEPEVWAMMLVGASLVGFRLRHRSRRASAARFA